MLFFATHPCYSQTIYTLYTRFSLDFSLTSARLHLIFKIRIDRHKVPFFFLLLSTNSIRLTATVNRLSVQRKRHHQQVLLLHTHTHVRKFIHSLTQVGNIVILLAIHKSRETWLRRERERSFLCLLRIYESSWEKR